MFVSEGALFLFLVKEGSAHSKVESHKTRTLGLVLSTTTQSAEEAV